MSTRRLSYAALMVALGLTGVYAETIPNFEVLTLVVFASGVLLGVRDGAAIGALTMMVYSLLNPYGAAHPLVTASQMAGEALAGVAGGLVGRSALARAPMAARSGLLAVTGIVLTVMFDLLTNLSTGVLFGQMRATLLLGIPLALWHSATNAVLFGAIGAPLLGVLEHYRSRLSY